MDYININPELKIPIYQQLVDAIRVAVKKGILVSGQKLPTVQEMTDSLGVARGTVKRAYDELEHISIIQKVQGRGTFVCYNQDNSVGRKEKAMIAIGNMIDYLENMGLSPQEINIFINLKLRERSEQEANVKVAAVECNPENLSQITEQLRHISGVDLYSFTLDNVKAEGYIDTGVKIIIGVVVGAVILGGLYALFKTVIIPRLNTEILEMFNYAG